MLVGSSGDGTGERNGSGGTGADGTVLNNYAAISNIVNLTPTYGSITITKDAVPDNPQDFGFTGSGPNGFDFGGGFSLDDDSDVTLPNTQTFNTLLPGTYSATEATVGGWSLTGLTCVDPDNGSTTDLGTATATIDLDSGENITCTFTNTQQVASIVLTKTPTLDDTVVAPSGVANAGDTITYAFSVENTGNVTITNIIITDPLLPTLSCTIASLAPGATDSCVTANNIYTLTQTDIDSGSRANTATATGNDPGNNHVTDDDSQTSTLAQVPSLNVVKEVSTNNSTWNDASVTVDDGMAGCTLLRGTDLTGDNDSDFEAGEEWVYTCSVTAVAGTNNNTATADTNETLQDSDSASYTASATLIADPALSKTADPIQATVGETVTFTLTATNQGNAPASNVLITDALPAQFDVTAVNVNGAPLGTSVNVTPPIGTGPVPDRVLVTLGGDRGATDVVIIEIVTTVNSLGNPPITNTASLVTSSQTDSVANNSAAVDFTTRSPRVSKLPATGFAPNVVTKLPEQPTDMRYASTDLQLEIPGLGIKIPIVSVPVKSGGGMFPGWANKPDGWKEAHSLPGAVIACSRDMSMTRTLCPVH